MTVGSATNNRNEEWKRVGLKATAADGSSASFQMVMFVECGMGCDQHGGRDAATGATSAAVRACRNAIEFNSIPCMSDLVPGGRHNMLARLNHPPPWFCVACQIRTAHRPLLNGLPVASGQVHVRLGVPPEAGGVDLDQVRRAAVTHKPDKHGNTKTR